MFRTTVSVAALLAFLITSHPRTRADQTADPGGLPSDADIRRILAERIDVLTGQEDGVGIVVGLIGPQGRRVISHGHFSQRDRRPVDAHTCFEIGSVTKAFTALLLADMVQTREVGLADPVAKYLPAGVKVPERNGRAITLLDLATHTSGLPFMPNDSVASSAPAKPGEGASQLWRFLASYGVPRDIGSEWDYSNIGYWLLSQALASRAGTDFETLLQKRVIDRLGLASTAFRPTPKMKRNLAVGHDVALRPSPSFFEMTVYKDMPAAGGLVSTANDLLAFLAVTMGYQRSSLDPAIAAMLDTRRPMSRPRESQGLGWVVIGEGDDQLIGHDGGAWGYASSLGWDPKKRVGIVVLSNHVARVDDIARHLLRPSIPLAEPARKRTEAAVASSVLDTYAGRYEAAGEGVFVIARERDFLTIQVPVDWGLPKLRLRPESLQDFFVAELPLRITFQAGGNGRIDGVLVYPPRGQKVVPAKRIN